MKYLVIIGVVCMLFGSGLVCFFCMQQQRLIGMILSDGSQNTDKGKPSSDWATTAKPTLVALKNDSFRAKYVGHTADGHQFFLTTPSVPGSGAGEVREFLALYTFDKDGKLVDAKIESFETRATLNKQLFEQTRANWLSSLGQIRLSPIHVQPFSITRFGTTFGFIPQQSNGRWTVDVMPAPFMSFHEPWDSGDYDS